MARYSEHIALRNAYIEKRDCGNRGAGIFALRDFKADEKVCLYAGTIYGKFGEGDRHPNFAYKFNIGNGQCIIPEDRAALGAHLANHSCNPNTSLNVDTQRRHGFLKATKSIKAGQEITAYYQHIHPNVPTCLCGEQHCTGQIGIRLPADVCLCGKPDCTGLGPMQVPTVEDDPEGSENLRKQLQRLIQVMRANGQRWVVGSVLEALGDYLQVDDEKTQREILLTHAFGDPYQSNDDFNWMCRFPR